MRQSDREINGHFLPLSQRCGLPQGLQYDFFLQVEETDLWYMDVLALMGLAPFAADGWAPSGPQVGHRPAPCCRMLLH